MEKKTRFFAWVPDGIYDYSKYAVRYKIVDGMYTHVVSKMWCDSGGEGIPQEELRKPWGFYPDIPPKPAK